MRTLQLVGNSTFGGATRLILSWCDYLMHQGCEVHVFSTDERTKRELEKTKSAVVRDEIFIPREIKPIQDIKAVLDLYQLLKREKYDVIHTYSATPSFVGRLAGFLAGTPVVVHHQAGWTVNEANSPVGKLVFESLEAAAILLSSKSICVSHAVADQAKVLPLIPKWKLVTICNGIEVQPLLDVPSAPNRDRLCKEYGLSSNAVLIGNTGRLAAQKDNATLIQAFDALKKMLPGKEMKLFLAGDGVEREGLAHLAESLGLREDVIFLGFRSDIPEFLSALDIFASPSLWEGLSISILEAMAARKPVVASSIPPNSELIEHEVTGLLVPTKSPEKLAQGMYRFIENPEFANRCAQAAQNKVLEQYTIDRMFDETYRLYIDLLEKKSKKLSPASH